MTAQMPGGKTLALRKTFSAKLIKQAPDQIVFLAFALNFSKDACFQEKEVFLNVVIS